MQVTAVLRPSARFALISFPAVGIFFGWHAAGALAGLALLSWLLLRPVQTLRDAGREGAVTLLGWGALIIIALAFVGYKLHFDLLLTESDLHGAQPDILARAYGWLRAISFSYAFLRCVDTVRAVAWGRAPLLNPLALSGHLVPFHMLVAGPLTPYTEFIEMDRTPLPEPTFDHVLAAAHIITTGLFFKIVIAQAMAMFLFGLEQPIAAASWIDAAWLVLYLYFDFAGYSLMALGIGRLLGVPTPINFDKPFLATSVTDFWTRWHVSLGRFVRNNIFLPIQLHLARRVPRNWTGVISLLPLTVSFVFVAMWHRMTVRFLLWGLAMGLIMMTEKLVRDRLQQAGYFDTAVGRVMTRVLGPVYALAIIISGFYFVAQEIFIA